MAQCPVRSCEICENSPGSRYCIDCEQFFCKSCEISHLKTKLCRNHIFQDADITNPEVKTPLCKQHGEKYTYYCNTCTSLTCIICLPTVHNQHDFCLIDSAASKARSLLEKDVIAAEDSIKRAKEKIITSRLTLINLEDEADQAKKDIIERVAVIIDTLNDKKDVYLKLIDKHTFKESQKLKQEILDSEKATGNVEEFLNKVKKSIAGENNVILMDSFSDMTKTLQSVSCVSRMTTIPSRIHLHPVTKPDVDKLIGKLNFTKRNTIIEEADPVNYIKSTTAINVGDRVRVKPIIKNPEFGWGGISHQSIGNVLSIQECRIIVNFPEQYTWDGYLSEIELA